MNEELTKMKMKLELGSGHQGTLMDEEQPMSGEVEDLKMKEEEKMVYVRGLLHDRDHALHRIEYLG
ncbi:hypothetical protein L195_g033317 [Trifolium pratense]|uniref:Uncharacterized protein n=1 Tax=Trifolium pratense TaxID=57577 RepID=A0A2K3LFN6_TRIPR|nr:hypothetical protein L195_g033317 [Trifolium pratense]